MLIIQMIQEKIRMSIKKNLEENGVPKTNAKIKKMTFQQGYQLLKQNAEKLSDHAVEPDIDELVQIMQTSKEAYVACQARIQAVKKAIQQYTLTVEKPAL